MYKRQVQCRANALEPVLVGGSIDAPHPQDQCILGRRAVVARAHPLGCESEPAIQRLGRFVGGSHLEGDVEDLRLGGEAEQAEQEPGTNRTASKPLIDGHGRDVAFVGHLHQPAKTDNLRADHRHQIVTRTRVEELVGEQLPAPGVTVGRLLDAQHRGEVPASHRADPKLSLIHI